MVVRWSEHKKGTSNSELLKKAIQKYSAENFTFRILSECISQEQLNDAESYWIDFYQTFGEGYNMTSGGDQHIRSKETCEKISKAKKGYKPKPESIAKMKESLKGRVPWNKGRKGWKNSGSFKAGHKHSPEDLEKMRQASIGRKDTTEATLNRRLGQLRRHGKV
jgi:group I intron endonuclease